MDILLNYPLKSQRIASRIIDGEVIIIDLEDKDVKGDSYYVGNPTATAIWRLINGKRSIGEIIHLLSKEFKTQSRLNKNEVIEFVLDLEKKGFLVIKNRPS